MLIEPSRVWAFGFVDAVPRLWQVLSGRSREFGGAERSLPLYRGSPESSTHVRSYCWQAVEE